MEKKEVFTFKEKLEVYEALKELWRSSDTITYKDLEKIQIKEWGGVAFKWATLRNRACSEGWNKEKGFNIKKALENKRAEILGTEKFEEVEIFESGENEYLNILKGIQRRYKTEFNELRDILTVAIKERDIKTIRFIKSSLEALEMARVFDLKLSGCLDIQEQKRLDIEILKLEILTLKTQDLFEDTEEKNQDDGLLKVLDQTLQEDWSDES